MDTLTFQTVSPPNFGASFTAHSDDTLVKCYDYLHSFPNGRCTYTELQHRLNDKYGIRPSNFRCIIPLAKSFGFVNYIEKEEFDYGDFFTEIGDGYIDFLKQINSLNVNMVANRNEALQYLENVLQQTRLLGLSICLKKSESDVASVFYATLRFLCAYHTINKQEFPFLWYHHQLDNINFIENIREDLSKYRNNLIEFNPQLIIQREVEAANPQDDYHVKTPGFTYIISTLGQCGLVAYNRQTGNYTLDTSKKEQLEKILK